MEIVKEEKCAHYAFLTFSKTVELYYLGLPRLLELLFNQGA